MEHNRESCVVGVLLSSAWLSCPALDPKKLPPEDTFNLTSLPFCFRLDSANGKQRQEMGRQIH